MEIQQLVSRKNQTLASASALLEAGLSTPALKEQYRQLVAEADAQQSDIDNLNVIEQRLRELNPTPSPAPQAASAAIIANTPTQRTNEVWKRCLKSGYDGTIPEHRSLLSDADPGGGSLLPQDIEDSFVSTALAYYAPLANFCRMRTRDVAHPTKVVRVDDRTNGLLLIQEGGSQTEVDPTSFSSTVVSLDPLTTGEVKFSNQLYDDSEWNLVDFLSELASARYGRGLQSILTKGKDTAGTVTPNNPGIVNIASVGTTTATLAAGVGWADIVATFDALDAAYLPRAVWQMTSKTRNALMKLEDGMSRPYFVPAPTADGFDMLLGRPIVLNQALDQLGTPNAVPIVFGSLWDGLEVVTRRLRVLTFRERYADLNMSALSTYTSVGSTALAPGAFQKLVLAAS